MTAPKTARARARAELTKEIKDEARRQLAEVGANGLSLRAVARELGMVSSALYRYFPSRDHLLTELIVDAYNAIGEAAEQADNQPGIAPRARWSRIWHATRAWAKDHPHEYALIYGSPIPGYQAPQDTIAPAGRVARALINAMRLEDLRTPRQEILDPRLREQVETVAEELGVDIYAQTMLRLLTAWTQLFGTISFELFGQYVGSVDPSDLYFDYVTERMADYVGL
ncbi:TetR/AcrR family transcriptional regulator [Amycolatopsis sp. NPDC059021]|uniref:TetR/AcrR family transcriptional regulator n=1 Tax=Amycolatopsis sp. NPDC059021 TaxID=3346704 RepID=UPI00366E0498